MRPSFSADHFKQRYILCSMCAHTIIVLAFMCNVLSVAMTEIYITGMNIKDPTQCIIPQACMSFNTATVQEVRNGTLLPRVFQMDRSTIQFNKLLEIKITSAAYIAFLGFLSKDDA